MSALTGSDERARAALTGGARIVIRTRDGPFCWAARSPVNPLVTGDFERILTASTRFVDLLLGRGSRMVSAVAIKPSQTQGCAPAGDLIDDA
jgi:hypothetical protein